MCGFVIAIGNFSETEIKAATQSISYRGPDDTDFFFSKDSKVKIGFNRLSIIDIDGGKQPFKSENGKRIIAYNGEIYNTDYLRKELESQSVKFRTKNQENYRNNMITSYPFAPFIPFDPFAPFDFIDIGFTSFDWNSWF